MRKPFLIIVCLLCANMITFAQKGKVYSAKSFFTQGKLDKAKELIDEAIVHEKCVNWDQAYFVRGLIYQAIFESQDANYKQLSQDALQIAWDAYQKVIELDVKNKYEKDLKVQYENLSIDFINQGITCYQASDYAGALVAFKQSLAINASQYGTQIIDTNVIFNSGLAAQYAKNYTEAEKFYKEALKYNYDLSKTYPSLARVLFDQGSVAMEAGDSTTAKMKEEEAINYLVKGHELFPADMYMLVELINYYLQGEDPMKAEKYLDAAIKQDPENADYYRNKGLLYGRVDKNDEAEKMFIKALELNPNDYQSQYSLGNIELNRVTAEHEKVNELPANEEKRYMEEYIKILNRYEAVVPYFEKVLELEPDEECRNFTMITLKELYYRLKERNGKPYKDFTQKYENVMRKLNN